MKSLTLLIAFAAVISAADKPATEQTQDKKRLETVTWDLKSHKLLWVVQTGHVENGEFKTATESRYEISPDDAIMLVSGEKRGFTPEEAASLHKLLDTLSLYCAESVVWWDQGQGVKIDEKNPQNRTPKKDTPRQEKVEERKPAAPPVELKIAKR